MFWSVIVTMSLVCAASSLYVNTIGQCTLHYCITIPPEMLYSDYMTATVVTTVDTMTAPLTEVFFPSVVVCNINQVGNKENMLIMLHTCFSLLRGARILAKRDWSI